MDRNTDIKILDGGYSIFNSMSFLYDQSERREARPAINSHHYLSDAWSEGCQLAEGTQTYQDEDQ